jgi:murein DD-endopeptidase MepM/ murein hydrolase activator NlpD
MSPWPPTRGRTIPAIVAAFYAGIAVGWLVHAALTPATVALGTAAGTAGDAGNLRAPAESRPNDAAARPAFTSVPGDPIPALRARDLRLPIDGAAVERMKGQFAERREGGEREHEAVDVLAPRNTPIHAVDDGTIAKLFHSKAGGTTIYQFDPDARFCYYYAHLERYAEGLHDGQSISRGEIIGYVGTSGNAPPDTPHLHFAIFELTADRHWWEGTPLDPYAVFSD